MRGKKHQPTSSGDRSVLDHSFKWGTEEECVSQLNVGLDILTCNGCCTSG